MILCKIEDSFSPIFIFLYDYSGSAVIGGNPHSVDSTRHVFTECIADFAISYNRALIPTEVLSIYQNPSVKVSNSKSNNVDSALISCASQT